MGCLEIEVDLNAVFKRHLAEDGEKSRYETTMLQTNLESE